MADIYFIFKAPQNIFDTVKKYNTMRLLIKNIQVCHEKINFLKMVLKYQFFILNSYFMR